MGSLHEEACVSEDVTTSSSQLSQVVEMAYFYLSKFLGYLFKNVPTVYNMCTAQLLSRN